MVKVTKSGWFFLSKEHGLDGRCSTLVDILFNFAQINVVTSKT